MKITCTLSPESLRDAAKQLRQYAESLSGKTDTFVRNLGEYGRTQADAYLEHEDTGLTRSTIMFTREGHKGVLSVGGYAVWIEFGTGVLRNVGENHPKAAELGMSDWGTYGKGHGADPNGWYYPDKYGGYSHTYGIQMNPFMYLSSKDMRNEMLDIAKEVFKSD